jgi:hypothetical protein
MRNFRTKTITDLKFFSMTVLAIIAPFAPSHICRVCRGRYPKPREVLWVRKDGLGRRFYRVAGP